MYLHSLPPAYKDASKADGGIGDLIIWHTLLEHGAEKECDLIFAIDETKADWWQRSEKHTFSPRDELVNEYAHRTGGHALYLTSLSGLLGLGGADTEVVDAVRRDEEQTVLIEGPHMAGGMILFPSSPWKPQFLSLRAGDVIGDDELRAQLGSALRYGWAVFRDEVGGTGELRTRVIDLVTPEGTISLKRFAYRGRRPDDYETVWQAVD